MKEPIWVPRLAVEAMHFDQLREHGGLPGLRDENALEAALARPQQKFAYAERIDLAGLAAAYSFGLARSHAFRDGNKRIAFLTAAVFLELNGQEVTASETDVVTAMVSLAEGSLTEPRMAKWWREHMKPRRSA